MPPGSGAATNDLSGLLQKGLFEEEANRNLEAAAQAYQNVSAQFDKDRKLAATAIFRLGEVYRKQNKTNEATAQYERILREFSDQDTLVTLSRQNLSALGNRAGEKLNRADNVQRQYLEQQSTVAEMEALLAQLKKLDRDELRRVLPKVSPDPLLSSLLDEMSDAVPSYAAVLKIRGEADPTTKQQGTKLNQLEQQVNERVDEVMAGLERRLTAARNQLDWLKSQTQPGRPGGGSEPISKAARLEQKRLLEEEITVVQKKLESQKQIMSSGRVSQADILTTQQELLALKRQLVVVSDTQFDSSNPAAETVTTDDEEKEIRRIQAMIKNSPDLINAASGDPRSTPLITAATKGQTRVASFLLDHGADVNLRANASTPLGAAVANGHKAMTELLLSRGANVNGECYRDQTALHVAADKGFRAVAEVLLANKAQLEARTAKGSTPLHLAAQRGSASLVQFLLSSGANVNAEDNDGITVLSSAIASSKPEIVRTMLEAKADPNAGKANLPLLVAIRYLQDGDTTTLEQLLRAGADANKEGRVKWPISTSGSDWPEGGTVTPLWLAVSGNKPEAVKLLLKQKADPNGKNPTGIPILLEAVANTNLLNALLEAGAAPDTNDGRGRYALLEAVWNSNSGAVEMLLAHGANPNIRSADGRAPLDYAAERKDIKSVELLVSAKADVNAKTFGGSSALHVAANQGTKDMVELLITNGANVNLKNKEGETPLHWAVRIVSRGTGSQELVALLLAKGADPNIRNEQGLTPLDLTKSESGVRGGLGFGALAVPSGAPGVPTRPLTGSVAPAKPDPASVAALLRQHGALDDLPNLDRIEVRRPEARFAQTVFVKGSNDWNQFTLLETILKFYWNYTARSYPSPSALFPDLARVVIVRPGHTSSNKARIKINLLNNTNGVDCSRDMPLGFGDVVEIPERDHALGDSPIGLTESQRDTILNYLKGTAQLVVNGQKVELPILPLAEGSRVDAFPKRPDAQKILLSSSDLSRVKVTRRDPATGKIREWVIDCSGGNNPDLWLRDGDVIEVPDKP